MRTLALAIVLSAIPAAALADRKAGDACAAGLSAPSKDIYAKTVASNATPSSARAVVVAETERLISEGKLPALQARAAAEAAGACLELIVK